MKDAAERAEAVLGRLYRKYPEPVGALEHEDTWQLLVATVLAAQCTDERVNKVTPELFRRWPDAAALAEADQEELQEVIHSTGFFRNKAKNLIGAAKRVTELHGGALPRTLKELTALPGLARKTANIVLSHGMGIHEGIAVDTHVKRVAFRLGLTEATTPEKVERDLMPLFPQEKWGDANHLLVFHGRSTCKARKPLCSACELAEICPKEGVTASA